MGTGRREEPEEIEGRVAAEIMDGESFPYATEIDSAWLVVDRLQELHLALSLIFGLYSWEAKFGNNGTVYGEARDIEAPRAICLAALFAMDEWRTRQGDDKA